MSPSSKTAAAHLPPGGLWLHRYALLVAACTLGLILAGAMVTSTGSGLSVPDWPLSYGMWFPPMVGGVFWEHGHRMIAGSVGFLTLILAVWVWAREPRRYVRWLAGAALAAVVVQAALGGITVLWYLPHPISIAHALLGQTFFCLLVALALFTSPGWTRPSVETVPEAGGVSLTRLAGFTTAAVYLQLLLGALYRHAGRGLLLHILGALLVVVLVLWLAAAILRRHPREARLLRPGLLLAGLVLVQVFLGFSALVLLISERELVEATGQPSTWQIAARSGHVVVGAAILATAFYLTLRCHRIVAQGTGAPAEPALSPSAS